MVYINGVYTVGIYIHTPCYALPSPKTATTALQTNFGHGIPTLSQWGAGPVRGQVFCCLNMEHSPLFFLAMSIHFMQWIKIGKHRVHHSSHVNWLVANGLV